MKKAFLPLAVISIVTTSITAGTVLKGRIMCNNPDTIRTLVQLDKEGKSIELLKFYSEMEQRRVCVDVSYNMDTESLGRKDLYGGVSQIGSGRVYVITREIQE